MLKIASFLLLAVLISVHPAVASDPVPVGAEFELAASLTKDEQAPASAHLGGDSFVTVWHQDESLMQQDIAARCISSAGSSAFTIASTSERLQNNADVVSDGSGGFIVVWQSHDEISNCAAAECLIKARRYNSNCVPLAAEFVVSTTTAASRQRPRIARGTGGDYLIVWQSNLEGTEDVYARILNSDGTFGSDETVVHADPAGSQTAPAVAARLSSEYVVTWESDTDIKARQVDSLAAGTGTEVTVNSTVIGNQTQPAVAAKSNGEFAVVWVHDSSNSEIFIQGFSSSAAFKRVGEELIANEDSISGDQFDPDIRLSSGSEDKFVVAWINRMPPSPFSSTFGTPIFISSLAASGPPFAALRSAGGGPSHLDAQIREVNLDSGAEEKAQPRIATDSSDNYLITWQAKDSASDAIIGRKGYTFVSMFSDGFESGDASAWVISNP